MYEVTIVGEFVTGTTCSDRKTAKRATEKLLLQMMKDAKIIGKAQNDGIFNFRVMEVRSCDLRRGHNA